MQIVETSLAVSLAFFYMPKTPVLEDSIVQVSPAPPEHTMTNSALTFEEHALRLCQG